MESVNAFHSSKDSRTSTGDVKCICPDCKKDVELPTADGAACNCGLGLVANGVLKYGRGYSESIVIEHERNLSVDNLSGRLAFDERFAAHCDAAYKSLCSPNTSGLKALSLGCGLGFEVSKLVDLGYDAYGVEMADLSAIWAQHLGERAYRCILSGDGRLPFADGTFDLITCVNVYEHVGTIPPDEIITETTAFERRNFILQAYSKLKPGGLLALTCSHRAYPFDSGHGHAYLQHDGFFTKHGFNYIDPFDSRNFLPAWADVIGACRNIAEDGGEVCLEFLTDQFLFGGAGPEGGAKDFNVRLDLYSRKWSDETGEPVEGAKNPHIQAFIRKASDMRSNLDLDGAWSVEWHNLSTGKMYLGEWFRSAYLPEAFARWVLPEGGTETDRMLVSEVAVGQSYKIDCTNIEAAFTVEINNIDHNRLELKGKASDGLSFLKGRRTTAGRYRYTF